MYPATLRATSRHSAAARCVAGMPWLMAASMQDALEGGLNASLNLNSHGKSWSYLILGLALDDAERG